MTQQAISQLVEAATFQERARKLDAVGLLRALVIAACTGYGGRQRDVARVYFENGAPQVARGGFYAWFGPQLEVSAAASQAGMPAIPTQALSGLCQEKHSTGRGDRARSAALEPRAARWLLAGTSPSRLQSR